jgi:hypothetical protein
VEALTANLIQAHNSSALQMRVATVVTNDVLFHEPGRRMLQDVVTCIRHNVTIDECVLRRCSHPKINLLARRQDHRHCFRMDRADLLVGFGGEKSENVIRCLAFLDLPDGRPARPDPGEAGERPGLIEREPDRQLAAVRQRLVLARTRERHDAAILDAEPASPVRGFDVPDIGDARIRVAPFQQERRRGHAPTRHRKFPTFRLVADKGCPIVRKYPRQRGQVTRSVAHGAGQLTDCLLAFVKE